MTTTPRVTPEQSRQDGFDAAAYLFGEGVLRPSMLTAEGQAETRIGHLDTEDPDTDIGDVAYDRFRDGASSHANLLEDDWEDAHYDAFLDGFHEAAEQLLAAPPA